MFGWFKQKPKQAPAPAPELAPVQPPEPAAPTPRYFGPNRVEEATFRFEANYTQAQKYRELIGQLDESLARATVPVQPGDTLLIRYQILIAYFGDVAKKLGIIQTLAEDPDLLVKVDINELQHGRCVIFDALRALDDAIDRIQLRQAMNEDHP